MANLQVKDGAGASKYLKGSGTGASGDPHVIEHLDTNSAAMLSALTTLAGAIAAGKIQIADGGGSITVDGAVVSSGDIAAGATDSGNPVKVGGVYTTAAPTLTDGQRGNLRLDSSGKLLIAATNNDPATGAKQDTGNTSLASLDGKITAVNTGAVVVASSALPSGAATAGNQSTANTSLASLDTKLGEVQASPTTNTVLDRLKQIYTAITGTLTVATHAVTQSGTWTVQPGNTANTTAWKVDGSAVTQPASVADGSDAALGAKADAEASTDIGAFSLIALFKHALTKLTTISTNIATIAGAVVSSVVSVAIAEKTLLFATGTINTSGDNTIISAPGSGQTKIIWMLLQNESSTATTIIWKFGTTAKGRVLGQNQGDGLAFAAPAGRAWQVGASNDFKLNLSGANSCGYSVVYVQE